MIKVIKGGEVYAPWYLGQKDILLLGDKIGAIEDRIDLYTNLKSIIGKEVIQAKNKLVVPGLIDAHVHITGGGGEGGFKTRTPEVQLSDLITAGITTVVGCLGTDGITRDMKGLYAKAKALEEEGISTFIYTGSYQLPLSTITGKIEEDLIFIDKVIGVGEIALSDHRSSHPSSEELIKIASATRLGGILSGKKAVVHFHLGSGKDHLLHIENLTKESELPLEQFLPTHVNRTGELFEKAADYARRGGFIDLTTTTTEQFLKEGEIKASKGLKLLLEDKVLLDNITFTSDGQGSLPDYDENGVLCGLYSGKLTSLYKSVRDAVFEEGIDLQDVLNVVTKNPARILGLFGKGILRKNMDADILIINKDDLRIETVISGGRVMFNDGKLLVRGTFEED